jgi:N-formylglutamate amidohydrolase
MVRDSGATSRLNALMDAQIDQPLAKTSLDQSRVGQSQLAESPLLVAQPVSANAAQTNPPVLVARPASQTTPLVFASPHSGRCYPDEFLAASRLDAAGLRRSEDSFVDELFAAAVGFGAPLVHATFPRAWCDPNREPWELDPGMFADSLPSWVNTTSARVTAGLGTIARVVASGETIYRRKITFAEAERRIETCWKPFHETVSALIDGTKAMFGQCVLIDCHSMPSHVPISGRGDRLADIILGDAHGTACAPHITRFVERRLIELGYRVRRNDPYAGGFITRHYGRPREHVHALQIEIARDLYMDELRFERSASFGDLQRDLSLLIESLAAEVSGPTSR